MPKYLVQHRRGTAEQWAEQGTLIPREGEIVIEIDEVNSLHKLKIGDGVHTYAELAYLKAGDEIVTQVLAEAKPRVITVELSGSWSQDSDDKYYQTLALEGITNHSRLDLQPDANMLAEFKQLGLVFVTENNSGVITVYSVGNMPQKAYTMQATIVETECDGEDACIIGTPIGTPVAQSNWSQTDNTKADFIKNKPDIYTKSEVDAVVDAAKIEAANQDVVVLAEAQAAIANKADKATTLAGYNISDAYTKTEIDDAISNAAEGLATEAYVDSAIGAIPTPDVSGQIGTHNTNTSAHNDIRDLITGLTNRLNALADSDDTTLDQMSEIVAYIKSNKSLIEEVTTNKVNVSDIINNLTTNVSNKPLSAAQGVALKALIDALPTAADIPTVNNGTLTIQKNGTQVTTFSANQSGNATANITVPTKTSELTNDSGFITGITVDSSLSSSSTNPVQNKVVQTALNKKMNDFSIEIYNGTSGNPKPVRFASFNYSTCVSEEGIAAKISLVSGHGNGTSYAFLEDAIIRVNHQGKVEADVFKYYGTAAGTYDEASRQYGDIFWLHDTTNKIVDFYVLMGQYARVQQTPWKRLTYSSKGTVTQHTSCTVYSSGDKVWANNSEFALMSDLTAAIAAIPTPDVSGQINTHNSDTSAHNDIRASIDSLSAEIAKLKAKAVTVHSGSEAPLNSLGEEGDLYLYTGA